MFLENQSRVTTTTSNRIRLQKIVCFSIGSQICCSPNATSQNKCTTATKNKQTFFHYKALHLLSVLFLCMQLLVELVQQCCQDLECLFHVRESAVLIVTMVDTAVAISTDLGRKDCGSGEKGGDWRGRGKRKWRWEKRQREINSRLHLSHGYNMTHLYIKPCLLEIFHQWKTASN